MGGPDLTVNPMHWLAVRRVLFALALSSLASSAHAGRLQHTNTNRKELRSASCLICLGTPFAFVDSFPYYVLILRLPLSSSLHLTALFLLLFFSSLSLCSFSSFSYSFHFHLHSSSRQHTLHLADLNTTAPQTSLPPISVTSRALNTLLLTPPPPGTPMPLASLAAALTNQIE